jgi:hypothetical protein
MGRFPEEELFNVPEENPLILTGQAGDKIRGKGGGKEFPDQIEPFRKEGPLPYPAYQPAGSLVEGLYPQTDPGYTPLPAGSQERRIGGLGISLQTELPGPFGKKGAQPLQEAFNAGCPQQRRGAAANVETGNPADLKPAEYVLRIPEEQFDEHRKPGIPGDGGKGIEITVITGPGAEGNVEIKGSLGSGEKPAGKAQGRPSRVKGQ